MVFAIVNENFAKRWGRVSVKPAEFKRDLQNPAPITNLLTKIFADYCLIIGKCVSPILIIALLALPIAAFGQDPGAALESKYGVVSDPGMNARVQRVAKSLNAAMAKQYPEFKQGKRLSFKILKHQDLNAIALPDGRIYITSGMMSALAKNSDDELFAVLAHEGTHIGQKHHSRQSKQTLIGAVLGGLLGKAVGGDVETGARVGGSIVGASYSRDDEYRADAGSVKLLKLAKRDPYAMERVLKVLEKRYGRGDAKKPVIGWLASHPDTSKRIENAERLAGQK